MTNAHERPSGHTSSTLWTVVRSIWLILVGGAIAVALYAFISPRVRYLCRGESPAPCTCFRQGAEPANFAWNRISEGPAVGVKSAMIALFLIGGFSIVLATVVSACAGSVDTSSDRFARVLPAVGVALIVAALVVFMTKVTPAPCTDQGALGRVANSDVW